MKREPASIDLWSAWPPDAVAVDVDRIVSFGVSGNSNRYECEHKWKIFFWELLVSKKFFSSSLSQDCVSVSMSAQETGALDVGFPNMQLVHRICPACIRPNGESWRPGNYPQSNRRQCTLVGSGAGGLELGGGDNTCNLLQHYHSEFISLKTLTT